MATTPGFSGPTLLTSLKLRIRYGAPFERYGRIDSLVNVAGLTTRGTLLDTTPELFDAHVAVNLRAPFFLMQAAVADMVRRRSAGDDRQHHHHVRARRAALSRPLRRGESRAHRADPERGARAPMGSHQDQRRQHRVDRDRGRGLRSSALPTAPRTTGFDLAATSVPMGKLGQVDEIAEFVVFLLLNAAEWSPAPSSTGTRPWSAPTTDVGDCAERGGGGRVARHHRTARGRGGQRSGWAVLSSGARRSLR